MYLPVHEDRYTFPDEYSGVQLFNGFYDKRNVKNGKRQMFLYGCNKHKYVIFMRSI